MAMRFVLLLCWLGTTTCALRAQHTTQTVSHTVVAGETLYHIAQNYGVSVEQVVAGNPGLNPDRIEAGQVIRIPVPQVPQNSDVVPQAPAAKVEYVTYTVKRKETLRSIAEKYGISVDELWGANRRVVASDGKLKKGQLLSIPVRREAPVPAYRGMSTIKVAVLLPLLGQNTEHQRSVEFYRGLLMGVDEVRNYGTHFQIKAYNEPAPDASMNALLDQVRQDAPDVLIGPLYPSHFADVTWLSSPRLKVVVPFSSKAPQVYYRPDVFLLNKPADMEEACAAELIYTQLLTQHNLVVLQSANGNRAMFCRCVAEKVVAGGKTPLYGGLHTAVADLKGRIAQQSREHYVLMPDADSRDALNQTLEARRLLQIHAPLAHFSILGYDTWKPWAEGDMKVQLHAADTYFLAADFFYPYTSAALAFKQQYRDNFHCDLLAFTPSMAPLGYDLARSFFGGMATYGQAFNAQEAQPGTAGAQAPLQSHLRFMQTKEGGGYVSRSMWLVHYTPDMKILKYVLP